MIYLDGNFGDIGFIHAQDVLGVINMNVAVFTSRPHNAFNDAHYLQRHTVDGSIAVGGDNDDFVSHLEREALE